MDIKVNKIQLRKNLLTKWDLDNGNYGDYVTSDANGYPIFTKWADSQPWSSQNILYIEANEDTYTSEQSPNSNYGGVSPLRLERSYTGIEYRLFFNFPIKTSMPSGATVTAATFYYYISKGMSVTPNLCYLLYTTGSWTENALTYNTIPATTVIGTGGGVDTVGWHSIVIPTALFTNFWYLDTGSPQITGLSLSLINNDDDGKYAEIKTRNDKGYEPYIKVELDSS